MIETTIFSLLFRPETIIGLICLVCGGVGAWKVAAWRGRAKDKKIKELKQETAAARATVQAQERIIDHVRQQSKKRAVQKIREKKIEQDDHDNNRAGLNDMFDDDSML